MSFTIKLKQFEGPFDLLLFFIERDELDIYDIPISKITNDFLDYIHEMEQLNLDLASEFILVAATLMRIKAKMLLPRKEIDEEGNEIDPRLELVQRLLEYKKYKAVLEEFEALEMRRMQQVSRGNVDQELKKFAEKAFIEAEWESVTLFKLMKAFEKMLTQFDERRHVHKVYNFLYTILDQQEYIQDLIVAKEKVTFEEIFGICENRIHAIITFLAMLELLNQQKLSIILGQGANNFWIVAPVAELASPASETPDLSSSENPSI
ncbi:MAG: segregation/condensation protein A [Saprospiraceae bacterium]|jgi:segregation and condensation protein A|nr:segregation/condensation protein A [Saprospiraceae bacterium]MBK7371108.1 segregation/condensation protein A [Saprospiraceae bacterium]MBK7609455.1 segregation/condensation protein A [Saprospiraceae bacterium]MBK8281179.1 segregation/condensation protein A [Saprospiraceae bacterium]MBK8777110.1 segregation/condensation protein A [Saprospiraceae bacterium]